MAPLDPSIYGQLQPNIALGMGDIVNRYVDQTQADADRKNKLAMLAQQGQMQALQLQQAKQQAADEAAYRQVVRESGSDANAMVQKLRAQGLHAQADQLLKSQAEQQAAGLATGQKRHEAITTLAGDIAQNPAQWNMLVDSAERTGAILPADAQVIRQQYMNMPVDQIGAHALQGSIAAKDKSAKLAEMMYPKPVTPSWHIIETDKGQMIVNANDPNAPKVFGAKPKQDNTLVAVIGPDGQTPILVQRSQAEGMTPAGGKGAASPTQHIADAKESNALLDQVEKVGDLATGSGLGKMRDISAGFFGLSTEGANNAAKLKVLGASLTAKVPKMSGPQSDKDVAMYKEAAGNIADPSIPWEQKKAAIATIREINNRQLSYGNDIGGNPTGGVVKTKTGATTSGW